MSKQNLLCELRTYTDTQDNHKHDHGQLILPINGKLAIKTDEHNLLLDERHLFYLPSESFHSFYSNNSNSFLVLDIPDRIGLLTNGRSLNNESYQEIDERWSAIRSLLKSEATQSNNRSTLTDLVSYACQFLNKNNNPISIDYIHKHYHESITVPHLALMENFNTTYYIEWFQKKTGFTPLVYIQNIRFEKAKEFLINTDLSILMITQFVGYEHQSSLNRLFKKQGEVSPSQFRKKYR